MGHGTQPLSSQQVELQAFGNVFMQQAMNAQNQQPFPPARRALKIQSRCLLWWSRLRAPQRRLLK